MNLRKTNGMNFKRKGKMVRRANHGRRPNRGKRHNRNAEPACGNEQKRAQ